MVEVSYEIVEHNGGWAYRFDGVYSETFPSHEAALKAAKRVADEQEMPGDTTDILYEDSAGTWHEEKAPGSDRPHPQVKDK